MTPTPPSLDQFLLPLEFQRVTYAKNQTPYLPLTVIKLPDGRVASTWLLDPNDLEMLTNGAVITIVTHTFNEPLQPISVMVGGADLR